MFDFDHLAPTKTARLTLSAIRVPRTNESPVVLILKHAGDGNHAFTNARAKTPPASGRIPQYERVARLYAKYVIVGWEHVLDERGAPVEYTAELGEDMLVKLINAKRTGEIDMIAAFAGEADNFCDPIVSASELGKG
jgi:hypothetical protein